MPVTYLKYKWNPPFNISCLVCKSLFRVKPTILRQDRSKYCSKKCQFIGQKQYKGYWLDKKFSKKHRKNLSIAHSGHIPWNKGKKHTYEVIEKMRKIKLGKKMSEETCKKISKARKGKKQYEMTEAIRIKISKNNARIWLGKKRPELSGDKHPNWKGGITPINESIRNSRDYKEWQKLVIKKDLYICLHCGEVDSRLEADHIKPFSVYPELRFDINNGQTLCKVCHKIKTKQDWKIIIEKRKSTVLDSSI